MPQIFIRDYRRKQGNCSGGDGFESGLDSVDGAAAYYKALSAKVGFDNLNSDDKRKCRVKATLQASAYLGRAICLGGPFVYSDTKPIGQAICPGAGRLILQ